VRSAQGSSRHHHIGEFHALRQVTPSFELPVFGQLGQKGRVAFCGLAFFISLRQPMRRFAAANRTT
jgi:hypothetical protein